VHRLFIDGSHIVQSLHGFMDGRHCITSIFFAHSFFTSMNRPTRVNWGMPLSERIVVDTEVLAGKPVIRGTRLAVEFILELLAAGQSEDELLSEYPGLTREDILACLSVDAVA
jgi:uncharacterized protein (DUF433 family)